MFFFSVLPRRAVFSLLQHPLAQKLGFLCVIPMYYSFPTHFPFPGELDGNSWNSSAVERGLRSLLGQSLAQEALVRPSYPRTVCLYAIPGASGSAFTFPGLLSYSPLYKVQLMPTPYSFNVINPSAFPWHFFPCKDTGHTF